MARNNCPHCDSAYTLCPGHPELNPPPPAEGDGAVEMHVRHEGSGLLALYNGDKQIREIGITPGWHFKDRDEFIFRYNNYTRTAATQPAEGDCPRCGCVDDGECLCPTWWAVSPQPDGGDEVECPHCVEGIQPMTFNRPCLHCKGLGVMPNE